jgi:hypothetical protein
VSSRLPADAGQGYLRAVKRSCAIITAACLAHAPACKKDPEPAPVQETRTGLKGTPPVNPGDPTKPGVPELAPPVIPTTVAALPTAPPVLVPSYAAALDPLLELVPTGAEQFMVVRDLDEVLDDAKWMLEVLRAPLLRAIALDGSPDPDAQRVIKDFDTIRAAFGTSGIDFARGLAVIGNGAGSDVLVFAAADPEALNKLFTTIGSTPSTMKCRALTEIAGFVACAEKDDGTLARYAPGKAAATLRDQLGKSLPGVELEHANLLGRWRGDDGPDAIAISTAPGLLELHVATKLDTEFETATIPGPAPALALAPAGSSFVWGRLDPAFLAVQSKDAPGIVTNVVKTMTGEYFFGSLAAPNGLVGVMGLSDPVPASGLVPMFSLVQDQLPTSLPDGTSLAIAIEGVDTGAGATVQTVHATATGPRAGMIGSLGLAQEGVAFVAGKYGAAVLGAGTAAVKTIATFDGSVEPAVAKVLPVELAQALHDGKASLAIHVEIDAMQNPALREVILQAAELLPAADPGDPAVKDVIELALGLLSPLSSASGWVTGDASTSTVHVALRSFGDPASDEGKAAHAAAAEVIAGTRDAKTVYAELAARYPDSPRAFAYRARSDGAAATIAPSLSGLVIGSALVGAVLAGRVKDKPAVAVEPATPAEPVPPMKSPR